jgi:hypothetical protein
MGGASSKEGVADSAALLRVVEVAPTAGDGEDVFKALWALPDRRALPASPARPRDAACCGSVHARSARARAGSCA